MFRFRIGQVVLYRDVDGWEYGEIVDRWVTEYGNRFYLLDVNVVENEVFIREKS